MEQSMAWILSNGGDVMQGILLVIGGAAVIAKLTPTKKDDVIIDFLLKILNGVALNPKKDKARD